jgi:hypothetical protein
MALAANTSAFLLAITILADVQFVDSLEQLAFRNAFVPRGVSEVSRVVVSVDVRVRPISECSVYERWIPAIATKCRAIATVDFSYRILREPPARVGVVPAIAIVLQAGGQVIVAARVEDVRQARVARKDLAKRVVRASERRRRRCC